MAEREEVFDVTIPANTTKAAPVKIDVSFAPGIVVGIEVVIPPGPAGLAGFALAQAHQRVLPRTKGAFFVGDDEVIRRDIETYLNTGNWQFEGFNEDLLEHTFEVRFQIREVTSVQPSPTAAGPIGTTPGGEVATGPTSTGEEQPGVPPGEGPGPKEAPEQPTPPEPPVEPPKEGAPPEAPPEAAPPPEAPATEEPPPPPAAPEAPATEEGAPPPVEPEPGPARLLEEGLAGQPTPTPHVHGKRKAPPHHKPPRTRTRHVTHTESFPAGGWLPHGARFDLRRTDQGQDFITNWKGRIVAPASGRVVGVHSDRPFPNGFGPRYCVVHIDSGPFGGRDWYIGHCTSAVHVGHRFHQGDTLAHADQGHVEGGGWVELGEAPGGLPGPMGAGAHIAHLFHTVTRKHTVTVHEHPHRKPAGHKPKPTHGRKPAKPTHKPVHKRKAPAHRVPKPTRPKRVKAPRSPRPKRAPRAPRVPHPRRAPAAHPHGAHGKHRHS